MTKKSVKDYYAVLGVPQTASFDEIRLAYHRQARLYHPDRSLEPNAEERFKEINEAYDVLADSAKRRAYDYFTADGAAEEDGDENRVRAPSPAETVSTDTTPEWLRLEEPVSEPPPTPSPSAVSPSAVSSSSGTSSKFDADAPSRKRIYPPTWAILLIVLGGCIIVGVAAGALLSLRRTRPTGGATSLDVSKLTTFVSPPAIPTDLTVLQDDGTPLQTVAPMQLDIGAITFPIAPVLPEQGRWPLPAEDTTLALWIHGTLINYVVGLPATPENTSLLSELASSDRMTVTLANGTKLAFGSPQVKRVDAGDTAPMSQEKPGLTLLLLGSDAPSRLVVVGRYLPEDHLPVAEQKSDGLIIEVAKAGIVESTTPTDEGTWPFVVEFTMTNTAQSALDPVYFDMALEDGNGQRYVLDDTVTPLGIGGTLDQPIEAGVSVVGSAGYIIPRGVALPLVWVFRADPTSPSVARFVLDFAPPALAPAQPDVELYEVFLDATRDAIVISGTVYNDGEMALQVAEQVVELTSSSGQADLVAASPQLPWTVPADGYQDFELQFSVPEDATSVLFSILGFTFEIEGVNP